MINKMAKFFIVSIIFACLLYNCKDIDRSQIKAESAIQDMKIRLGYTLTSELKLERSVKNGEFNFEIQFLSSSLATRGLDQVVVFINSEGKSRAIPFFSNSFLNYWDFELETTESIQTDSINTTFIKELGTALDIFDAPDSTEARMSVINELFQSVLRCRTIQEGDSSSFINTISPFQGNSRIEENVDSCRLRNIRNWDAIYSEMNKMEAVKFYNAMWDKRNRRVYQIIMNKDLITQDDVVESIRVFRMDCMIPDISL